MKRAPGNSPEGMIKAMADAAMEPIPAPKHVRLRDGDAPFWDGILRARARDEWIDVDLVVAAQLARTQHDIETESARLEVEGTTTENARGTPVMNPRVTVLEQLARREMALMRALRMAGRPAGDPQIEAGRRSAQRSADKVRGELEEEELLAS